MTEPALDASAVSALLNQEPGYEQVLASLPGVVIGSVTLTEVISELCENGVPVDAAQEAVGCFGAEIVPHTAAVAVRAGALRPPTQPFGLSLGERCCLALGQKRDTPVVTADRMWDDRVEAAAGVRIMRIRPAN